MTDKQYDRRYVIYDPDHKKYFWHDSFTGTLYTGTLYNWYNEVMKADLFIDQDSAKNYLELEIVRRDAPNAYVVVAKLDIEITSFLA